MPIIAKNIIVGNKLMEEPKAPPVKTVSFTELKQIEQPVEQYKHVKDGDLHKLFNTKSDYLRDMAALENNK